MSAYIWSFIMLQWSRLSNKAETRDLVSAQDQPAPLQWSRLSNKAETLVRDGLTFEEIRLQWSRLSNKAETSLAIEDDFSGRSASMEPPFKQGGNVVNN